MQEADGFDLDRFLPLLRERIAAKNPFVRQFLLWLSVLNAVPDLNLLARLPDILDGVFRMLAETRLRSARPRQPPWPNSFASCRAHSAVTGLR